MTIATAESVNDVGGASLGHKGMKFHVEPLLAADDSVASEIIRMSSRLKPDISGSLFRP